VRELATVWHKGGAEDQRHADLRPMPPTCTRSTCGASRRRRTATSCAGGNGELLFKLGSLDQKPPPAHWYCDAAPVYTDVRQGRTRRAPKLKGRGLRRGHLLEELPRRRRRRRGREERRSTRERRNKRKATAAAAKDPQEGRGRPSPRSRFPEEAARRCSRPSTRTSSSCRRRRSS